MFASEKFIESTRPFVCIRIETYENKESEKMVRSLLGGAYANTSFCIFDPQGKKRLSRSGRSPSSLAGRGQGEGAIIREMNRISSNYESNRKSGPVLLPDANTFRQALNVASADQRLLVILNSDNSDLKQKLREVFSDKDVVGRFHVDRVTGKSDKNWQSKIEGERKSSDLLIVRSGQFGLKGKVMKQLTDTASKEEIKNALLDANTEFSLLEERKHYNTHVSAGLRQGIFFENEIPYGEDRDGDGKIDRELGNRRRR